MKTLILNDTHFGVRRTGGTTPESRQALEDWMFHEFEKLLQIPHDELIILGDLCDKRAVPEHIMVKIMHALRHESTVTIVLGNHDLGGVGDKVTMSSCELIANLLDTPAISGPVTYGNIHIIPHMFNQAEFDEAVSDVPNKGYLLLHCNINNPFAVGDHSLNLSDEQIKYIQNKGVTIISAHEHQPREYKGVHVIGNQIPTSVADCYGDNKRALIIDSDIGMEWIPTLNIGDVYDDLPYEEMLEGSFSDSKFVRVSGECEREEYQEILRVSNEMRKNSGAFVISNLVKIKTSEEDTLTADEVTAFNILDMLLDTVDSKYLGDIKLCI